MTIDLAAIKAAAEKATSRVDWAATLDMPADVYGHHTVVLSKPAKEHIAAANPAAVLKLVAVVEAAQALNERTYNGHRFEVRREEWDALREALRHLE